MERKIGEIFEYNGEWYQCVEGNCAYCSIKDEVCEQRIINDVCKLNRIFKKLEKVGEPYRRWLSPLNSIMVQRYRLYGRNVIMPDEPYMYFNDIDNTIEIEIKPTKENMEEKYSELIDIVHEYMDKDMTYKYFKEAINDWVDDYIANKESNKPTLKPFDIQKAREGKPVCTRNGHKARIICFDRRLFYKNVSYPILALVERSDGEDDVCGYNEKGKVLIEDGAEYKDDLMMLPEKKEGWVNVYKNNIYKTKEEAFNRRDKENYLMTIKVDWEE